MSANVKAKLGSSKVKSKQIKVESLCVYFRKEYNTLPKIVKDVCLIRLAGVVVKNIGFKTRLCRLTQLCHFLPFLP